MTSQHPTTGGAKRSAVHLITLAGDLDENGASRLLHSCGARLHLLDIGQAPLTHIVVDLTAVTNAAAAAVAVLDRAYVEAERRGVGLHLIGVGSAGNIAAAHDQYRLSRFHSFPDMATALATLDPGRCNSDSAQRAVDPDALVIDDW